MSEPREDGNSVAEERAELYGALKLVGGLGFTICFGIIGFFLGGLYLSRRFDLGPAPIIAGICLGVGLSGFQAYRMLTRHLTRLEPPGQADERTQEADDSRA